MVFVYLSVHMFYSR